MHKRIAVLVFAASIVAPVAVSVTTASAEAPVICNFGGMPQLAVDAGLSPSTQAPGLTGAGPLNLHILADGTYVFKGTPPAFAGWTCV